MKHFLRNRLYPELALFPNKKDGITALNKAMRPVGIVVLLTICLLLPAGLVIAAIIVKRGILIGLHPAIMLLGLVFSPVLGFSLAIGIQWIVRKSVRRGLRAALAEQGVLVCAECGYDLRCGAGLSCSECGAALLCEQLNNRDRKAEKEG